jgi:hypothetical protein
MNVLHSIWVHLQLIWATVYSWEWTKVIPALTGIWTAVIATKALQTWRKQSRAAIQTKLLDDLIEAAHEFIDLMNAPIAMAEFVMVSIIAHEPPDKPGDRFAGALEYIKKRGADDSKRLLAHIDKCRDSHKRLTSLNVKGQVLLIDNYNQGFNSVTMIAHQMGMLEALAMMIDYQFLNWDNPVVRDTLEKIIAIDVNAIKNALQRSHIVLLAFATGAYARIYGK